MLADRLASLVVRLHGELSPGAQVRRWEGAWDALESPGTTMLAATRPNVLVSLLSIALTAAGRSPNVARALRSSPAAAPYEDSNPMIHPWPAGAGPQHCKSPFRGDIDPDTQWPNDAEALPIAAPTISAEIAVTLLASDPNRCGRSDSALALLPQVLPVLIDFGAGDITGVNLYSEALAAKRFAGFAVTGQLTVSLDDNLRRRLETALADRRLDLADAALEIGVSASELSSWQDWGRHGDYARIDQLVLGWLAFTPEAVDLVNCRGERFQVPTVSAER